MIFDLWWDTNGTGSHFLAEIKAPKETVEIMVKDYNKGRPTVSFVTFLRMHNIPARNIDPIKVEFYKEREAEPDFALRC